MRGITPEENERAMAAQHAEDTARAERENEANQAAMDEAAAWLERAGWVVEDGDRDGVWLRAPEAAGGGLLRLEMPDPA